MKHSAAGRSPKPRPRTAGRPFLWAAHRCAAQATYPKVWRTEPARAQPKLALRTRLPPYLVLLRVGFALPAPLLERRCALTAPFHPYPDVAAGRYVFCGTFRQLTLTPASRTLSGTLLCGVRTFLPLHPERCCERPSGPAAYISIICDRDFGDADARETLRRMPPVL